jgi:hypothetical protein
MLSMTVRALLAVGIGLGATGTFARAEEEDQSPTVRWKSDYAATMAAAEREHALMVIYFRDAESPLCRRFDEEFARSAAAESFLADCRCVRLSVDAEIVSGGTTIRLLEHPAFAELQGSAGLIVLDFATDAVSERGQVLRTLPLRDAEGLESQVLEFFGPEPAVESAPSKPLAWLSDYAEATAKAEREGRMLLIYFAKGDGAGGCTEFETRTLSDARVREGLDRYVCLQLADDARVNHEGAETVLLRHSSFSEMVGLPGIAIVDFSDPKAAYFGQVVSTFPFLHGKAYDPKQMSVILNLPPGKLTQRTLIYAVRTHPDAPKSTSGQLDPYLLSEAESHSVYQARIRLQGHHTWESRFQRINRRLPGGLLAAEVCAESWPGQNLLEAAIDCVQCWRQSSGHWRSVRAAQPVFGYDIRRGSNGIWYATGIFGKRGG